MKTRIALLTIGLLFLSNGAFGQDVNTFFANANTFFKTYVSNGKVDYKSINNDATSLNELLLLAKEIKVSKNDAEVYQAFWINAYNISVIRGIIDNYPIKSPLDKAGFFDKTKHDLGGKNITLNDIEHKLLRGQFNDARFHFVLVCGALGCPPLISQVYLPNTLDAQLEKQTKIAINGSFIRVNAKKKRVQGSEILKWYKEDFVKDGSEIDFLNKYRKEKIPENFKLSYFPYNWNINKQ